jgi:hypothetical protein
MMNRERQILQDINQEYGRIIKFSETDEVSSLDFQDVEEQIQVPARIEGRYRQQTVVTKRLAQVATYASLSELLADKKKVNRLIDDDSWTMDDMPSDVLARHEAWCDQDGMTRESSIREELHKIAGISVDRMSAKQACPDCPSDTQYACRTSGWSRELYRYPLIQVEDEVTEQIYEVPLDTALYIDLHPTGLHYGSKPTFDSRGFMTAYYCATLAGSAVSGEYVRRATNNTIEPQANQLKIIPGRVKMEDVIVYIGGWQENGINTYMEDFTAEKIAVLLQDAAMKRHAERVSEVDYNQIFHTIRRELGQRGLALAFRYKYMGMGESDAEFSILNSADKIKGVARSIDAYEALIELKDELGI